MLDARWGQWHDSASALQQTTHHHRLEWSAPVDVTGADDARRRRNEVSQSLAPSLTVWQLRPLKKRRAEVSLDFFWSTGRKLERTCVRRPSTYKRRRRHSNRICVSVGGHRRTDSGHAARTRRRDCDWAAWTAWRSHACMRWPVLRELLCVLNVTDRFAHVKDVRVFRACYFTVLIELLRYRPQTISATTISATDEIGHRPNRPQPIPYRPQWKSISATDNRPMLTWLSSLYCFSLL